MDCALTMDMRLLCVELQSYGVRFPDEMSGRTGGAGPSEGQVLIVDDHYLNVPSRSWFVQDSPYRLEARGHGYALYRNDIAVRNVSVPERPQYYDSRTSGGVAFSSIALVHGRDCFASTVYQDCKYWRTPLQCRFCGIGISRERGVTVLEKRPDDLGRAALEALRTDGVSHVTLTAGVREDNVAGRDHLLACVHAIKDAAGIPVHVQVYPATNLRLFDELHQAGADTVGIHIETCSARVLDAMAPCKAVTGIGVYEACWEYAVSVFGKNQVSSFLIAGLGDTIDEIVNGAELMCRKGVFPYVLPLRPVPGTPLDRCRPPSPDHMRQIYERVSSLLVACDLASRQSRAGCVRCGACSCLMLYEDAVPAAAQCREAP